jgi:sugar/nucleoside kinase (ribokinase family)
MAGRPLIRILKSQIDILGLGCAAVDEVLYVAAYPPADTKTRVLRREQHCGGLTATALVAASRLGAKCAYAGVLGDDAPSRFVLSGLRRASIDVSGAICRAGARPVQSVVVVDEKRKTRNIFYDLANVVGADNQSPSKELICSAKVLFVDNFGVKGMIRAVKIARADGIPVVADFESSDAPRFEELLSLVDHLILSQLFACKLTSASNPASAATRLWNRCRSVVIVTCGANGCFYLDPGARTPKHVPAFKVKAQDTTGCGDVFHGAYTATLARGLELQARIQFASAAAAIKATRHGGQAGIPTRTAVEKFLMRHRQ